MNYQRNQYDEYIQENQRYHYPPRQPHPLPVRQTREKLPSASSKALISFIKLLAHISYVIAIVVMVLGLFLGFVLYLAQNSRFLRNNYFFEATLFGLVFGGLLGIVAGVLFLSLLVLLVLNRKGWLKNAGSAYLNGIIATLLLLVLSLVCLYVSKSYLQLNSWTESYFSKKIGQQRFLLVIDQIWKHLPYYKELTMITWWQKGIAFYFHNFKWTSWVVIAALVITAFFGNAYIQKIDKTQKEAELFYSRRRW